MWDEMKAVLIRAMQEARRVTDQAHPPQAPAAVPHSPKKAPTAGRPGSQESNRPQGEARSRSPEKR